MLSALGFLPFISSSPLEARETSSVSAAPTVSFLTSEPHTPFTGTPSTTGALTATSIGTSITEAASVSPVQTAYPANGRLNQSEPAPYVPAGGVGTNGSIPVYNTKSDFDYESLVSIVRVQFRDSPWLIALCRPSLSTRNGLSLTCSRMVCVGSLPRISRQLGSTTLTET